jgi:tRNA(Ser,Leu) C12 N-acetylase TAN1
MDSRKPQNAMGNEMELLGEARIRNVQAAVRTLDALAFRLRITNRQHIDYTSRAHAANVVDAVRDELRALLEYQDDPAR